MAESKQIMCSFEPSWFNRSIRRLPEYVAPSEMLPTDRKELASLHQRWTMWQSAGVPIRDVEALKWFAVKWINRDYQGRTKREAKAADESYLYASSSSVIDRLQALAGGTFPIGAKSACEAAMTPYLVARQKAEAARRARAREAKKTPLGMDPESKLRLRFYELMTSCAKEALKEAAFRAPANKGAYERMDGELVCLARRDVTARGFELDHDAAVSKAKNGKRALSEAILCWEREGHGSRRPLQLAFNVTARWYTRIGSKGLASLFGPRSFVLDVRTNANGVPEYLVAQQRKKSSAEISLAWGIRSLDKNSSVVLKVVEERGSYHPNSLYR